MKFVAYIPFGYPNFEKSHEIIDTYFSAGTRAFEISMPEPNPVGESEMITNFMHEALKNCDDYYVYLREIEKVRNKYPNVEINLLLFYNIINNLGDDLVRFCNNNNVNAIICPDSKKHFEDILRLQDKGLRFTASFHYDGNSQELENISKLKGFVYMQAYPPTWQKEIKEGFNGPKDIVDYLRVNGVTKEIYAGVGIKDEECAKEVKEAGADGFFVGGTLMALYDNHEELYKRVKSFIAAGL